MSEYKNPRPSPTASASDPCTIVDNAVSLDKVINGDSTVTTYTGKQILSMSQAIKNIGFAPADFDFTTGGTLSVNDRNIAVFYETDGNWYSWGGALPKTIPPASSPASTGGIAVNAWNISTSAFMYRDWEGFTDELYAQAGIVDDGLPDVLGNSKRVKSMSKIQGAYGTTISLAAGTYPVGAYVRIKDRYQALVLVKSGGTANGVITLDAGNGNTADIQITNGVLEANHAGFDPTNTLDNKEKLDFIKANSSGIAEIHFGFGTYKFSQIDLLDSDLVLSGVNRRTTLAGIDGSPFSDFIRMGSASAIKDKSCLKGVKLEGFGRQQDGLIIKNLSNVEFDVEITGFATLVRNLGGLSYQFKNFKGTDYNTGFFSRKSEPSDSITTYNNHIQFTGQCHITGGSGKAVDHDDGYGLYFEKGQIDFCGTASDVSTGGIFVGQNVGSEVASSLYPAIVANELVIEGVKGRPIEVRSGSVVIDTASGFGNEDRYVLSTLSAIYVNNFVDASANAEIRISGTNNKAVFINTVMTNGIKDLTGAETNERVVKINSGTGEEAQGGFSNLSLVSLYVGSHPSEKLSDADLTFGGINGSRRVAADPASGPDSVGYNYLRNNNYLGQDGYRNRSRSHAWHTNTNAFQMGISESGNVSATSFSPFTGVHYFFSEISIPVGLAVDLISPTIRELSIYTEDGELIQLPFKANGDVTISSPESRICAGVVQDCIDVVGGYMIQVAAVGDNRSGMLHGFKVDNCSAGDILCTGTGGALKVAPSDIPREVVTFKAMSESKDGLCYGYF